MNHITLSDGEWKVMKVLWERKHCTLGDLVQALDRETGWTKSTIFVMLKRMIAKGAVRMDDSGRLHEYYPLIKREEITPEETDSFLTRVYDGSIGLLVSSLVGRRALSEKEIDELKQILEDAKAEGEQR